MLFLNIFSMSLLGSLLHYFSNSRDQWKPYRVVFLLLGLLLTFNNSYAWLIWRYLVTEVNEFESFQPPYSEVYILHVKGCITHFISQPMCVTTAGYRLQIIGEKTATFTYLQ